MADRRPISITLLLVFGVACLLIGLEASAVIWPDRCPCSFDPNGNAVPAPQ